MAQLHRKLYTSTSPTAFVVPAGVTKVLVRGVGAGGAGGGGAGGAAVNGGGAGGGGAQVTSVLVAVTPGASIDVTAGTGGTAGTAGSGADGGNGGNGGDSTFGGLITFYGGQGGAKGSQYSGTIKFSIGGRTVRTSAAAVVIAPGYVGGGETLAISSPEQGCGGWGTNSVVTLDATTRAGGGSAVSLGGTAGANGTGVEGLGGAGGGASGWNGTAPGNGGAGGNTGGNVGAAGTAGTLGSGGGGGGGGSDSQNGGAGGAGGNGAVEVIWWQ